MSKTFLDAINQSTAGNGPTIFIPDGPVPITLATVKMDALPTIASGFGTSPFITPGSTPFAGSVNVGTGGAASSGVINFNGAAFPIAPFIVANTSPGNNFPITVATTSTQVTLSAGAAWIASTVISWICVSTKQI